MTEGRAITDMPGGFDEVPHQNMGIPRAERSDSTAAERCRAARTVEEESNKQGRQKLELKYQRSTDE